MKDLTGTVCIYCELGIFKENHLLDDLKGVLHCNRCGKEIERYFKVLELSEIMKSLLFLSDVSKYEVISNFCKHCGSKHIGCQCWKQGICFNAC